MPCTVNMYSTVPGYMTPLRTWSTVHVAGLLLTALPHLQDLTNEMPSGDLVVCKQSNAAFSCALGPGKSPSYTVNTRLYDTLAHLVNCPCCWIVADCVATSTGSDQ